MTKLKTANPAPDTDKDATTEDAAAAPLRILTCGGSGDGKSALVEALLSASRSVSGGQAPAPGADSGIVFHHFASARRKFIVADTHGHDQYIRNLATGPTACDFAILLADARKSIAAQTRHHCCLMNLLGIRKIVLAVNKMDLADFSQQRFDEIAADFARFAEPLNFDEVVSIPVSAEQGDNIIEPGAHMPWYQGPTLMEHLDNVDFHSGLSPSAPDAEAEVSDQVAANVIWLDETPMLPGRRYFLISGNQTVTATISTLKYKLNVSNLEHQAGTTLELDEIGYCNLSLSKPIIFDPYAMNRDTGAFFLIDRRTKASVGVGMIEFGLRRATNISWQKLEINKSVRATLNNQKPCALWFTGLSGSGKSTIASLLEKQLHAQGRHTYVLDGDNVRHGLNKDLGFTDADRVENIRRISETARLFVDAGLIVLVSFISPFRSERRMARDLFEESEFVEVFVDTPIEVCEQRDPKGLYKKARAGEIKNFTGIDSAYEEPERADIHLRAAEFSPDELVAKLIADLEAKGFI